MSNTFFQGAKNFSGVGELPPTTPWLRAWATIPYTRHAFPTFLYFASCSINAQHCSVNLQSY